MTNDNKMIIQQFSKYIHKVAPAGFSDILDTYLKNRCMFCGSTAWFNETIDHKELCPLGKALKIIDTLELIDDI